MSVSLYFSLASILCTIGGILCNLYATKINDGKMPVRGMLPWEETDKHKPLCAQTKCKPLTDWIVFSWRGTYLCVSLGDVLLSFAIFSCGAGLFFLAL